MNLQDWRVYNKNGSHINWTADPFITLEFVSATGVNAAGFLVTNPSGYITSAEITNGGHSYEETDTVMYNYVLGNNSTILTSADASIVTIDVSIFNPDPSTVKSISDLTISTDASGFIYPSTTYAGAIFLNPISQGLVETEHLFILQETSLGAYIRPYDPIHSTLVFKMIGDESQISFFTVDEEQAEITWCEELTFDVSLYVQNTPLTVNIGFRSEEEGVFERIIRIYHSIDGQLYTLGDIVVNAEAIGEDERFRTLISNFGLFDPIDFPTLFKGADINESLPDWEILNPKSKHLILEHDKIMPYIGTYKGLINAIKWLDYDDIYVREWFKDVKENRKISFIVPFDADDRTQTILMLNAETRRHLKKLNQLSLVYCLTRETGELDVWGTPLTENCYAYNLSEVFIKLLALKQWLERNIIGINCRIIDISGEGIYFERIQNLIYANDNVGYNYTINQHITPYALDKSSELIHGDASLHLTLLELSNTKLKDLNARFIDLAEYAWNPNDPNVYYSLQDASYLADPSSYLLVGATFSYPLIHINEIMWKLSVEKDNAGVIGNQFVSNPLFIYENDIRFYNILDISSMFYDVSTHLAILLENAYLRDPSIDEWTNSIAYTIYPDPCDNGNYVIESSIGVKKICYDYLSLRPATNSRLTYAYDDNYKVPLLLFNNYKYIDASNSTTTFTKPYYLDIIDGKIIMENGIVSGSSDNYLAYINWNYDTSLNEQMITLNVEYYSPRMRLYQIDPCAYYYADPSGLTGGDSSSFMIIDNSIYTMHVNHIGDYNIELFAWDSYNTILYNPAKQTYPVWIKYPTIYTLIDNSVLYRTEASTYLSLNDVSILVKNNSYPIFDRVIPLQGLSLRYDDYGNPYISVPSITYFQDLPEAGSLSRFINTNERILTRSGNTITVDEDYQNFYVGDDVRLIKYSVESKTLIQEVSSRVLSASGSEPRTLGLDQIPSSFVIEASTDLFILNDTYRAVTNASNNISTSFMNINSYIFEKTQMVTIKVADGCTGYSWGSTYQVKSVDGSVHTLDALLPQYFLNNPGRFTITAKHAFSSYCDLIIETLGATEVNNNFKIYLKDSYCQERYLDNTFVYENILFDYNNVNEQWYDASMNLINSAYYYYNQAISTDISTLVILRALYDPSSYLLNQKNIWTVRYNDTNKVLFKVFNTDVPYVFDVSGNFKIIAESYDSYGNLIEQEQYITLK